MERIIETSRLVLTLWKDEDLEPFAAMNADPHVMRFYPSVLSRPQSDELAARIRAHFEKHGFGLYAVRLKDTPVFAGYTGLNVPAFSAHFTPCVEMGWRLGSEFQGRGIATEAASAVRDHAFTRLGLRELVAFTIPENHPSRNVMRKIGMEHDVHGDFEHPSIPEGHRLRRHLLYRLSWERWHRGQAPD